MEKNVRLSILTTDFTQFDVKTKIKKMCQIIGRDAWTIIIEGCRREKIQELKSEYFMLG